MREYWPNTECKIPGGAAMELRASLAWELLRTYGLVAGQRGKEDTSGRAALELLPADEAVARCFHLADAFVSEAEKRGALKPFTDADCEKAMAEGGRLNRVRNNAEFPRGEWSETLEKMGAKPKAD